MTGEIMETAWAIVIGFFVIILSFTAVMVIFYTFFIDKIVDLLARKEKEVNDERSKIKRRS